MLEAAAQTPAVVVEQRGSQPEARRERGVRSLRDLLLDALEEIGFMAYSQQLTLYVQARFGRSVPPTRFGTVSADEARAHARGATRAVWLGHGLTGDRAEPVKRLWGRSDWPLTARIVTPVFGRAQYLRAAARFAELAMKADGFAAEPDRLRYLAADHAKDLGLPVRHGRFDLDIWRATAEEQLVELRTKEAEMAERSALQWNEQLSAAEKLFGRDAGAVLRPVPKKEQTGAA